MSRKTLPQARVLAVLGIYALGTIAMLPAIITYGDGAFVFAWIIGTGTGWLMRMLAEDDGA